MENKKFTKNDQSFKCLNCNSLVDKLGYTSRDHCPACLYSIHIDNSPGDRANECKGLLVPIGVQFNHKGTVIIYKCNKCNEIKRNISSDDDNIDEIIKLSTLGT